MCLPMMLFFLLIGYAGQAMIDTGLPVSLFFRLVRGVCILLSLSLLHVNIGDFLFCFVIFMIKQNFLSSLISSISSMVCSFISIQRSQTMRILLLYHIEACTSVGDLSLPLVQEFQKHLLKTFFNGYQVHNESASHQHSRNRKINCITVTAMSLTAIMGCTGLCFHLYVTDTCKSAPDFYF